MKIPEHDSKSKTKKGPKRKDTKSLAGNRWYRISNVLPKMDVEVAVPSKADNKYRLGAQPMQTMLELVALNLNLNLEYIYLFINHTIQINILIFVLQVVPL